jgi:hypothetical protein
LDRVQPTAIGSPPDSFRLREMASVPDSASVPSAERERGIEKTDELRRLKNARNRKFESTSLQRRVCCELDFGHYGAPRTRCSGLSSSARALLLLFPVERAVRAPFSSSLVRLCFNRRLLDIRISCSNSCNFAYIASPRRDLIQVNQSDRIYSTAR